MLHHPHHQVDREAFQQWQAAYEDLSKRAVAARDGVGDEVFGLHLEAGESSFGDVLDAWLIPLEASSAEARVKGVLWITNHRLVFQAPHLTAEAPLLPAERIACHGDRLEVGPAGSELVVTFGEDLTEWVRAHLEVAVAVATGTAKALASKLHSELTVLAAQRPS